MVDKDPNLLMCSMSQCDNAQAANINSMRQVQRAHRMSAFQWSRRSLIRSFFWASLLMLRIFWVVDGLVLDRL